MVAFSGSRGKQVFLGSSQLLTSSHAATTKFPITIAATATKSLVSDSTLSPDSQLVAALSSGATYKFEAFTKTKSFGDSGVPLLAFSLVSGASMNGLLYSQNGQQNITAASSISTGTSDGLYMAGAITVGATAGNFQFQWRQLSADATATVIDSVRWITIQRTSA